ncbi:MAG: glutamate 5-kinase [Polyangiaceae bacterium]|nr:glutamate 5-kinase [Polyangiaceae bacterium]
MPHREVLPKARRIVVKIGSRVLAEDSIAQNRLAADIAGLAGEGRSFVLVSSGAIAIGVKRLGYRRRPREMARLQAAAAAGQAELMRRYDEVFMRHGLVAAQVLLTHADLADRERLNNARAAFAELLDAGAIPVVNENDTVATEEIRFGDNDQLASMVTPLVGADLLVLLTDVPGVLDERGHRISVMAEDAIVGTFGLKGSEVGTGGIRSKIDAAWKATRGGAAAIIAPAGQTGVLRSLLAGANLGTFFPPSGSILRARKQWIAYTLRPHGAVLLDPGAVRAVQGGRSSVLPVGVLGVRGLFAAGDAVRLLDPAGGEVGRGLTRLGAMDVARSAGVPRAGLATLFGSSDVVVVHKDDLVISP